MSKLPFSKSFKDALKGKTVVGFSKIDFGDFDAPVIEFSGGLILVIQQDPEGNGPGFGSLQATDGDEVGYFGG